MSQQVTESARAVREYMKAQIPGVELRDDYIDMLSKATDSMEQHDAWNYLESGFQSSRG